MNTPCEICSGDRICTQSIRWTDGETVRENEIPFCYACNHIYTHTDRKCDIWTWTQHSPFVDMQRIQSPVCGKDWPVIVRNLTKFFRKIHTASKKLDFVTVTVCGESGNVTLLHTFISRRASRMLKKRWSAYGDGDVRFSGYFKPERCRYFTRVCDLEFEHVSIDERPILEKFIKPRHSDFCITVFDIMLHEIFMDGL